MVTNLNHLVARETDPLRALVLSVTTISGGHAPNVVPGTATLTGTIRTLDDSMRRTTARRVEEIAHGVAMAHRATAKTSFRYGPPVVKNDPALAEIAADAIRHQLGDGALTSIDPVMGGDDFACYAERVPGVYLLTGAGHPGDASPSHHNPRFTIDERSLTHAARIMAAIALRLSNRNGGA
jgi:amidohydrolase